MRKVTSLPLIAAAVAAAPFLASAHTSITHVFGFFEGLIHPVSGLDHILAMLGVGIWAALLGTKRVLAVPAAFVFMMLVGGMLGVLGVVPVVELGIVGSVIGVGLLIAFRAQLPLWAAFAIVGVFALFHGAAHGAEIPSGAVALPYFAGFAISTALLHVAGIMVGKGAVSLHRALVPAIGTAVSLAGVMLLFV